MGMTSKRAQEQQTGKGSTRRMQWCAHLQPGRNVGDKRTHRRGRGVAGVGEELAKFGEDDGADIAIEQSTTPGH
jgi:hypothetical protein